jgi:hypothetical protein
MVSSIGIFLPPTSSARGVGLLNANLVADLGAQV